MMGKINGVMLVDKIASKFVNNLVSLEVIVDEIFLFIGWYFAKFFHQ